MCPQLFQRICYRTISNATINDSWFPYIKQYEHIQIIFQTNEI